MIGAPDQKQIYYFLGTECKYWPIYPCYSEKKPMISCIHEYTNDPISVDQTNPDEHSSSLYMYEKMMAEGHDPRMFRFSPDASIKGGHSPPQNYEYWRVGCLGITSSCSKVRHQGPNCLLH